MIHKIKGKSPARTVSLGSCQHLMTPFLFCLLPESDVVKATKPSSVRKRHRRKQKMAKNIYIY